MKKLLMFILLLLVGIVGCNKEDLNHESSSQSKYCPNHPNGDEPGYFAIYNYAEIESYSKSIAYPINNQDKERVISVKRTNNDIWSWDDQYKLWRIEHWNNEDFIILSNNHTGFTLQRSLDVDLSNPNPDKTFIAVIDRKNGKSDQSWLLIGTKEFDKRGYIKSFTGVVVNKYTGQMLQLGQDHVPPPRDTYLMVDRQYKGSDEEKYFLEQGSFYGYADIYGGTTVWVIERVL
ncbi:MAG: hypothetical protein ACQPRJ_05805 [Solitalea-like symbiont of Acarus siro]